MAIPVAAIVEGITTLLNTAGIWVTKQKADKTEAKRQDLGRDVAQLQAELQKQTEFIASLTKQVQALAVQVQKQEAASDKLKAHAVFNFGMSILLLMTMLWMIVHR